MFTLFFVTPEEIAREEIQLIGTQAHHAISVLRVQKGEQIRLADGSGTWIEGAITDIAKDSITVQVHNRSADRTPKTFVSIAQAVLKGRIKRQHSTS